MNFKSIINDICCDNRIKNGIFRLDNEDHVFILQEYLEKAGYSIEEIVSKTAKLFEEGRFPERQAYNKDGILVTFPNKEYRDRAVDKGTHFAENPKKGDTTLFAPGEEGDLSTADIKTGEQPKETEDSVSLDKELDKKISGDEKEDERTSIEKSQDAVAVQSILTGETPLVNYSVDEAIRYGFYNRGFNWYDSDGNFIGEQFYNENTQIVEIISEKKTTLPVDLKSKDVKLQKKKKEQSEECNAIKMENWIDDEINNRDSNNSIAKKIAQSLKESGVISSKSYGDQRCPITNPIFKTIKETSKTDLILTYEGEVKKASLKNENSSLCQAQNEELNAVITTILKLNNEEQSTIDVVSSFIIDGLNKNFYTQLEETVKNKFQSTLSEIIKLSKTKKLTQEELEIKVKDIKSTISDNKKYIQTGCFDVDVDKALMVLNNLFADENKRMMFMREMITGEHRWGGDQNCIADHLMCWDCSGQQVIYSVDTFIQDNLYKINFRFRNRGGKRGICMRSDTSTTINEILNEELQKLDEILNISFKGIFDAIKNLGGDIKDFFVALYDYVINELKEIKILILKFFTYLKNLAKTGWESFIDGLGFEVESEGSWIYRAP